MKKVAFHTLGCKVNQYETEAMEELFEEAGYEIVKFSDVADVYVVNTCTVTNIADKKSRQMLSKARKKNDEAIIVAVGCYVQVAGEKLQNNHGIDLIIGSKHKNKVVELVEAFEQDRKPIQLIEDIGKTTDYEDIWITKVSDKTRAYIKIQDGCNQFCSYCIIPYTRGRIRSRKMGDIIKEVETLATKGYREIVLTGIHLASYGKDQEGNVSLIELLAGLNPIEGIERIRFGSLEPNLITRAFLDRLVTLDKVCPHFHLSLQSGSNSVLKRMNRKYTTEEFAEKVALIREAYTQPSITTDIIVGFPGETDEEFETTLSFASQIRFTHIHVFKYSMREGTKAAQREDQVDPMVKSKRSQALVQAQEKILKTILHDYVEQSTYVLYEEKVEEDRQVFYLGYTDNYMKVKVVAPQDIQNQLLATRIDHIEGELMVGKLI